MYETYLSTDTDAAWDAGHNNCGGGCVWGQSASAGGSEPVEKELSLSSISRSGFIHTRDKVLMCSIILNIIRSLLSLNVASNAENLVQNSPLLSAARSYSRVGDTGVAQGSGRISRCCGGCTHVKQLWLLVGDIFPKSQNQIKTWTPYLYTC